MRRGLGRSWPNSGGERTSRRTSSSWTCVERIEGGCGREGRKEEYKFRDVMQKVSSNMQMCTHITGLLIVASVTTCDRLIVTHEIGFPAINRS